MPTGAACATISQIYSWKQMASHGRHSLATILLKSVKVETKVFVWSDTRYGHCWPGHAVVRKVHLILSDPPIL